MKPDFQIGFERFYLPGRQNPVTFAEGSEAFKILVGLRDEAHRVAISFHRQLRGKESFASALDSIPGLGPTLIKRLLMQFDSVDQIREASMQELYEVPGITTSLAEKIHQFLNT